MGGEPQRGVVNTRSLKRIINGLFGPIFSFINYF